jgi:heterodisulfide reductase subunit C
MAARAAPTTPELAARFLEDVYRIPGGEKIRNCIQCGTCSGLCPTADEMDFTPREIIAAFRAGMLDRVLQSNTVWLCTSCYSCTVRCPSDIKVTDLMYELKRLGVEYGMHPKDELAPALNRSFVDVIESDGRNSEGKLLRKFYRRAGYRKALPNARLGFRLWRLGRVRAGGSKISSEGRAQMSKLRVWVDKFGEVQP